MGGLPCPCPAPPGLTSVPSSILALSLLGGGAGRMAGITGETKALATFWVCVGSTTEEAPGPLLTSRCRQCVTTTCRLGTGEG